MITHVQTVKGENFSATTTVVLTGVVVGNLLVVNAASGVTQVSGVTDDAAGGSNTYTPCGSITTGTGYTQQWYCVIPTGKGGSITLTFTASVNTTAFVSEFNSTNGWLASPVDKQATNSQASPGTTADAITSGVTATRTQGSEVLVGLTRNDTSIQTWTAGTGWTMNANGQESDFSFVTAASEYKIVTTTGTDAATFTFTVDGFCDTLISGFMDKPVPAMGFLRQNNLRPAFFKPGNAR